MNMTRNTSPQAARPWPLPSTQMGLPERLARTALAVKCKIQPGQPAACRARPAGRDALVGCHSPGGGPVSGLVDVVPRVRSLLIAAGPPQVLDQPGVRQDQA